MKNVSPPRIAYRSSRTEESWKRGADRRASCRRSARVTRACFLNSNNKLSIAEFGTVSAAGSQVYVGRSKVHAELRSYRSPKRPTEFARVSEGNTISLWYAGWITITLVDFGNLGNLPSRELNSDERVRSSSVQSSALEFFLANELTREICSRPLDPLNSGRSFPSNIGLRNHFFIFFHSELCCPPQLYEIENHHFLNWIYKI